MELKNSGIQCSGYRGRKHIITEDVKRKYANERKLLEKEN